MRKVFGDYLLQYQNTTPPVRVNKLENTKAVVFLEDERSFWVPLVLKNYATHLDDTWNFYWFGTDKNYEFLKRIVADLGWDIEVHRIQEIFGDMPHQMSADTFNAIFKHEAWWNWFKEPTILTAQLDTVLLRPFDDKWLQYDMIGAPCNVNTFNGGLCLRSKYAMLEALRHPEMQDMRHSPAAEDVYFTTALRVMNRSLPSREEATAFSIENFPVNVREFCPTPFGVHGTNHYYLSDEVVSAILSGQQIITEKPKLFIASPVYKWPPHPKFIESIQNCQNDPRFEMEFRAVVGDAHIERARSMTLLQYLQYAKPWDWFVMIDSDIEFNADILWGLINAGKPVIGAAYAFKAAEGSAKYGQPVIRGLSNEEAKDGLLKVKYLGGGFTLVRNDVLQRMIQHYDDLKFFMNPDLSDPDKNNNVTYGLWNPVLVDQPEWGPDKKEMLSEDYSFCQRILDMGEDVWLDMRAFIAHWDGDTCYRLKANND